MLALTHVHADHQGVAKMICERYRIPLACHVADVPTMQGDRPMLPDTFMIRLASRLWAGPPYPVARILHEGDEIAGFRVVHAPGHTPGHIILFREEDRVAIVGDVLNGMNLATSWPGLHEPPGFFTADVAENRRSIRRLAELEPRLLGMAAASALRHEILRPFSQASSHHLISQLRVHLNVSIDERGDASVVTDRAGCQGLVLSIGIIFHLISPGWFHHDLAAITIDVHSRVRRRRNHVLDSLGERRSF